MKQTSYIYIYVGIIVPLTIIIPVLIAIFKYRHLSSELKIAAWYLFLGGFSNFITSLLAFNNITNIPVFHFYTALELTLLCIFYKMILGGSVISRYIHPLIVVFLLLCVVNVLFFQNLFTFNSYTKTLEAIIIVFLALAYFKKNLDETAVSTSPQNPVVYINSGVLIYFSGSLIIFVIENLSISNITFWKVVWTLHASLLMIMYQLFAVALWKFKK